MEDGKEEEEKGEEERETWMMGIRRGGKGWGGERGRGRGG